MDMKIQEAIEILSEALRYSVYTNGEDWKALEVVKDAAEKQTPMKPEVRITGPSDVYSCSCGNRLFRYYSYCYKCGQAIDWSTDEN